VSLLCRLTSGAFTIDSLRPTLWRNFNEHPIQGKVSLELFAPDFIQNKPKHIIENANENEKYKNNVYKNSRGNFKKNRGYKTSTKSKTGTRGKEKKQQKNVLK
jgi:hypothetical protein